MEKVHNPHSKYVLRKNEGERTDTAEIVKTRQPLKSQPKPSLFLGGLGEDS